MIKKLEIYDRALMEGRYIIDNDATIRQTAKAFCISKSTVHKDLTDKLLECNKTMYYKVQAVLQDNKAIRHIRGGEATKRKHLKK